MQRWSSLSPAVVAICCLMAAASPSSGQGPYYATPAWDLKLPGSTRFVRVLFDEMCANNICAQVATGILDRETGLVWERVPSTSEVDFSAATIVCAGKVRGGRAGWRLPDFDELASLIDPSVTTGVLLPAGHPFSDIGDLGYWTRTVYPSLPNSRLLVNFNSDLGGLFSPVDEGFHRPVWCVRGGAK
jgi:hypothetical protein